VTLVLATLVLLTAACGSDGSNPTASVDATDATEADSSEPADEEAGPKEAGDEEAGDEEAGDVKLETETGQVPELGSGVVTGSVEVNGSEIEYALLTPEGFEIGDSAPVLVALPPGGQNLGLAQSVLDDTYRTEALARGWVVVSPAAPDGTLYFQGSEVLIPSLLDWVETWVTPEGGAVHLAGISNGGRSAFRVAVQNPDRVASLVVFPGFPDDQDLAGLEAIAGIPIHMFVGGNDTGWIAPTQVALDALTELGADASFEILEGEGHVMASLSDGKIVFDLLDAARR